MVGIDGTQAVSAWKNTSAARRPEPEQAPGAQFSVADQSVISVNSDVLHGLADGETTLRRRGRRWRQRTRTSWAGVIAANVPGEAEVLAHSARPVPAHFQQVPPGHAMGNGKLWFRDQWDSTSGSASYLSTCAVGEKVNVQ